jgi:hypothetical protein
MYPTLFGCDNAAKAMEEIVAFRGFKDRRLWTTPQDATLEAVTGWFTDTANKARKGDIVLFTFAGHGDQLRDGGDEPKDQAIVLYDRLLIDDSIYLLLKKFEPGVRIVFVTDCCYSGTIFTVASPPDAAPDARPQPRPAFGRPNVRAEALLLSACKDTSRTEAAEDSSGLPPFTRRLKTAFDGATPRGHFDAGYFGLLKAIDKEAQLFELLNDPTVSRQDPFIIF